MGACVTVLFHPWICFKLLAGHRMGLKLEQDGTWSLQTSFMSTNGQIGVKKMSP